jgi:hypothetical protein
MKKHNAENERTKHRYFAYLREADGRSDASLDVVAKALSRFEEYTSFRDSKGSNDARWVHSPDAVQSRIVRTARRSWSGVTSM